MSDILERAYNAEHVMETLSQNEREKLAPLVEEIKAVQREIDVLLTRLEVADKCEKCTTNCCSVGIESVLTEEYLFFLLFDLPYETYFDVWKVLQRDNTTEACRFLAKKGCIIPTDSRPFVCKSFFCGKFGPMRKTLDAYCERFYDAFYSLEVKARHLRRQVIDFQNSRY